MAAVRKTKELCGKDAHVGFAREHANSTMLAAAYLQRRVSGR